MKKLFLTFLVVFAGMQILQSQVVTTDPEFPAASDSVIIYFDATQGDQGLMNYAGDIYAHSGLITDFSSSSSDWRYVIADWNENTEKARLAKMSENLYKLKIKPAIKDFYGVPEGEEIQKIAFVFRNSDGTKTGRGSGGADIFADVYPPGLNLNILSPTTDYIMLPGESVQIEASSNNADSMFLFIDDALITKVEGTSLTYSHTENTSGSHLIKIRAKNTEEENTDSVYYFVRGTVNEAALPAGWIKGINYLDSDSVGLVLFAPYKEYAFVTGDFTNWRLDEDYMMNKTPDGNYYWLAVGNLSPNTEYIFQYYIDGEIKIADPYAEQVSDPNDKYIEPETYPGLISYPEDKTSKIAAVLETNQSPYQWKNTDFVAPSKENLIIYELLVRDFIANHDYKTLTDTLDYLDSLGINAVELMPVNEFEGNESWGYNPSFYFAPDKYYGPKEDLKAFIDSCHGRGIAVIIDMVLNHSYGQSPLVRMYFEPNAGEYGQPTAENPWYNQTSPNTSYSWGFDFNHESQYTKEFVDSVNSFWLKNYNVDGFRFDFTKGFTNTSGDGWEYDASRIAILKRMADEIWKVNNSAYVILEHFTDNSEEIKLSGHGMLLWGNINQEYAKAVKGFDSDLTWISYKERTWTNPHLIGFMESHDEERLMHETLTYGNSSGSYDASELEASLERMELAANFFIPVPGPKMIWQFGELGYDISIDYDCRVCNKPIHWEYYEQQGRLRLYQVYKTLNTLKQQYDVFKTSDFVIAQSGKTKTVNLNGNEMNVVILGNFDVTSDFATANFPSTGEWYELYSGDTLTVTNTQEMISLSAGDYRLYTDVKLEQPDIISSIKNIVVHELQHKVYPNPSSGTVYFELGKTDSTKNYKVDIYNLSGQLEISRIFMNSEIIELEISTLEDGLYFYKLMSDEDIYSGKVLKQ